jgi:hypothetical protein
LAASHAVETREEMVLRRVEWPNADDAQLLRTPLLEAFVDGALGGTRTFEP